MRQAKVLFQNEEAGILTQYDDGAFGFIYHHAWIENPDKPSISLTLPKKQQAFRAPFLFPFFYNMLPEGSNKQVVCRHHRIDQDDYFSILIATAKDDSIGAVTVAKIEST
jgi:HipA-like protein